MTTQLPTIKLSGRTYAPALDAQENLEFLLETLEDESRDQIYLEVSLYFNKGNNTYAIGYTGERVEYNMTTPLPVKLNIEESDIVNISNYIKAKLEAGDPIGIYEPATSYYLIDQQGHIGNIFNYRWA